MTVDVYKVWDAVDAIAPHKERILSAVAENRKAGKPSFDGLSELDQEMYWCLNDISYFWKLDPEDETSDWEREDCFLDILRHYKKIEELSN